MNHSHRQSSNGILALAARAALRFAARRNAPDRYGAWRPIALFWSRQHKRLEGVRAGLVALTARAVWLPTFHLHFMTHMNDSPWRRSMSGSSPFAAMYQRRVVMAYDGTIVQSNVIAPQRQRGRRPEHVLSHRQALNGSDANGQVVAPYARSARRTVVLPTTTQSSQRGRRPEHVFSHRQALNGSDANGQVVAPYTRSARRTVVLPTTTQLSQRGRRPEHVLSHRQALNGSDANGQVVAPYTRSARRTVVLPTTTRVSDRDQRPSLERTHLSVHSGTDARAQTLQILETSRREPLVFRLRSETISNAPPQYSQESVAAATNFHPQQLTWRRAMPLAAGIAGNDLQPDSRELAHQSLGRSIAGQESSSEMHHPFGHAPGAPAMKLDSSLMDRLTDDVIRRVERRARIERARRGL